MLKAGLLRPWALHEIDALPDLFWRYFKLVWVVVNEVAASREAEAPPEGIAGSIRDLESKVIRPNAD